MVGNYGVPDPSLVDEYGLARGFESGRIQASALIVQDYSRDYSHWNAQTSLGEWMAQEVGPGRAWVRVAGFASRRDGWVVVA